MNIVERRRPQDGQLEVDGRRPRARHPRRDRRRPSSARSACCVSSTRRRAFLDSHRARHARRHARDATETLIRSPYGMVICAGPTGSGKTTTLYATLAAINDDELNVMTIEDPVEYVFPIDQPDPDQRAGRRHVRDRPAVDPAPGPRRDPRRRDPRRRDRAHRGAGRAHRSLRHVVAARDRRDRRRCTASSTWASSRSCIASSLLGVVGQRLVRRICPHCIEPYTPTLEELAFFERRRRRRRQGRRSCTARAATSAATPATSSASACTRCCASPTRSSELDRRRARRTPTCAPPRAARACARCATRPSASSPKARPPSPRSSAPCTSSRRDEPMPQLPLHRARRRRRQGQGRRRVDERSRRCAASCCASNLEVADGQGASARSRRSRSRKQRVKPSRRSCTSRGSWRRSCAPASRSPTASTSSPTAPSNKRFRKILLDDQRRASRRACRSPTRSPQHNDDAAAVLPRHHPLGRADRPPRHRARAALRLHGARPRGQAQDQVGADVPAGRARACRSSRSRSSTIFVLPKFADFFDEPRRQAAAVDAHADRRSRNFSQELLVRVPARRLAPSSRVVLCGCRRRRAGNRVRDRVLLRLPLVSDIVQLLGRRAHLPDPRRDVARRRAAPRGDARRRSHGANNTVFEERLAAGAGAHARRRGSRRADRRHRPVPARRGADDARRRGDRHARPAARERGRVLRTRARLQAQAAHDALRAHRSSSSWASSSASSRSRSCRRCTASTTPARSATSDDRPSPFRYAATSRPASRWSSCS